MSGEVNTDHLPSIGAMETSHLTGHNKKKLKFSIYLE